MSGYTVKITAKLPVANTDVFGMAKAVGMLDPGSGDLLQALTELGLRDIEIEPTYRPKLKLGAE